MDEGQRSDGSDISSPDEICTRQSLVKTDGGALALPSRETLCRVLEKSIIPAQRMAFGAQEQFAYLLR
jgi:hypothetical protein